MKLNLTIITIIVALVIWNVEAASVKQESKKSETTNEESSEQSSKSKISQSSSKNTIELGNGQKIEQMLENSSSNNEESSSKSKKSSSKNEIQSMNIQLLDPNDYNLEHIRVPVEIHF